MSLTTHAGAGCVRAEPVGRATAKGGRLLSLLCHWRASGLRLGCACVRACGLIALSVVGGRLAGGGGFPDHNGGPAAC